MSSPTAVSPGALSIDSAPSAPTPITPKSAMAPPGPTTPVKAAGLPSIMSMNDHRSIRFFKAELTHVLVTAPTPTSAIPSPRIATGPTLTRSDTLFDIAAALAENSPPSSSSSNAPGPSSAAEPSITASNASAANFLAPPPKNTRPPVRDEPGVVKQSVIAHFVACGSPFGVRVWDENAKERLDVTPGEIRTLAQIYGETREWTMNIEEVFCEKCVEGCKVANEKDYKHHIGLFLGKGSGPDFLNAFLRLRGRHNPGSCNHRNGISQLLRDVGVTDAKRIRRIVVTSSDDSFQDFDKVTSAISIIIQSFPNIQKATIKLRSDESLITDGVAGKLARAFGLLEERLPEEEGLVVKGLERQPILAGKWGEVKRGWWERRRAFGRKVLG
ncbi:hypothetical protein BKA65DRAFT_532082 [Rhexocercosporidium sp. MPI-PUGE-AT-0058]|nr:hypothetical protein BKA65DRAFT_532082 [Rhexocercosporidium sp. MPI-PUGE-AT-0058]